MRKDDNRPQGALPPDDIIWDAHNRKHLIDDHPERHLSTEEITEALTDENRLDIRDPNHGTVISIGLTSARRLLLVAWTRRQNGIYPVHAREAGRRQRKDYDEAKG